MAAYNLRKFQQSDLPASDPTNPQPDANAQSMAAPSPMQPSDGSVPGQQEDLSGQKFTTQSLMDWIEQHKSNPTQVRQILGNWMTDQTIYDDQSGNTFQAGDALNMDTYFNSPNKGEIADRILRLLPPNMRAQDMNDDTVINTKEQSPNLEQAVAASNEAIKKLAQNTFNAARTGTAKTEGKGFNLRKEAQSKSIQNVILYGPETNRFDPDKGIEISKWHTIERNKGWGLKPSDIFNLYGIDYETFWRKNIMDKYYQSYKNKDGKWVGGYLNKRFEVDRNVPDYNNMQFLPGETRKPDRVTLTEGQLQKSRNVEPYNWRKAQSAKLIKAAGACTKCNGGKCECRNCGYDPVEGMPESTDVKKKLTPPFPR